MQKLDSQDQESWYQLERIDMREKRFYLIDSFQTAHQLLYIGNSNPKVLIT